MPFDSLRDGSIINIHVKNYSQTYLSHKYCIYINMFIFKLYYQTIYSKFLFYIIHIIFNSFYRQFSVSVYIVALAPNTFIINMFYIQSIYFYGTPFIFLPLPNIYALSYENICNNRYGKTCSYVCIFVMTDKV